MTEEPSKKLSRRTVIKTTAAIGTVTAGSIGLSGAAAADKHGSVTLEDVTVEEISGERVDRSRKGKRALRLQEIQAELGVDGSESDVQNFADSLEAGDITVEIGGRLINISNIDVTVIGGDLIIDIDIEDVIVAVVAQLCVAILGEIDECDQIANLDFVQN